MTGGTRKKLKSRPTREFSRRIKDFTSSPLFPERGLTIRGEADAPRRKKKTTEPTCTQLQMVAFQRGQGWGEERADLLEKPEVKATKILASVTEV